MASNLSSGLAVPLKTKSGKPATIQLFRSSSDVLPVITYDGKEDTKIAGPFHDQVSNTSGYPQLIPLPDLPTRG